MCRSTVLSALTLALLILQPLAASAASAADKPNIVYILVDNWGWGDISVQGSTVQTPRIDALAAQGLRLTNFNVQNQCTPTRSALHTGRLPVRSGTQKVAAPGEPDGLSPWEYTIAELLSDAGYATALYGKWHVGSRVGRLPSDQGYDEWWGINEGSNAAAYTSTPEFDPTVAEIPHIWQGTKGLPSTQTRVYDKPAKRTLDSESTKKAIAFIKKNSKRKRPFYVYVGFTHFHPPWGVHPDFANKSKAGLYADTKMEVDHNVGLILDAINQAGIDEDTLVILTGDNGAANYPSPGLVTGEVGGSNGPWRGGLSTAYEGGMRTPAMFRWPGKIGTGKVSDEIVADLDLYPTLATLAGASQLIPEDRPIDGISQADFFLGLTQKSSREHVVTYVGDTVFAVKWRDLKIHFAAAEGTHSVIQKYTFPQVFNIKEDPKESYELWGNEGYAHAWVMGPITRILAELQQSMQEYPNIEPGQEFSGYP
jgi:arylsulfatase A-like enzyme